MRLAPRPWHVLVLLLQTISIVLASTHDLEDHTQHRLYKRDAQIQDTSSSLKQRKTDTGTKDAPVDGLDGKPHAGPFIEPLEVPKIHKPDPAKPQQEGQSKPSAEEGVMNDPTRTPPKTGTTGTEGGVSEKSKDREAHESETRRKPIQKPQAPKDADSVSHKEHVTADKEKVELKEGGSSRKTTSADSGRGSASGKKKVPESTVGRDPSPGSSKSKSLLEDDSILSLKSDDDSDDDDDDDDEYMDTEEGKHDLIRWDSLAGSFSSIAATEIGDKTFIVAALMAMRHPRLQVFTAAFSALFIMTILSGVTGHAVGALISKKWAALVAAGLFLVFGAKSLKEGYEMDPDQGVSEEIKEVQAELEEKEVDMARANGHRRLSSLSPDVLEAGRVSRSRSRSRMAAMKRRPSPSSRTPSPARSGFSVSGAIKGIKNLLSLLLSPAWVETFGMTFIGELGDRSQIATVAMAAGQEYFWIMVGASLGHFVCTAVAVLGGSVLAGRVSMRKGEQWYMCDFFLYVLTTCSNPRGWIHIRGLWVVYVGGGGTILEMTGVGRRA